MDFLKNILFSLTGPIDNASDDGIGFRKHFIKLMEDAGIQAKYFDPTNKPTGGFCEIGEEKRNSIKLREDGKYEELAKFVHAFRYQDMRYVDMCDVLIAYIDPDVHMCGSYDEILRAEMQRKPRMCIIKGGRRRCPLWLFDVFPLENMFDSVEECVSRLALINAGQRKVDPEKWICIKTIYKD